MADLVARSAGLSFPGTNRHSAASVRVWISPIRFATNIWYDAAGALIQFRTVLLSVQKKRCLTSRVRACWTVRASRDASRAAFNSSLGIEATFLGANFVAAFTCRTMLLPSL